MQQLAEQTNIAVKNEAEAIKQKEIADRQLIIAEEQKKIAVHSSKAKEQFLATMSHEIRTPLNAIIGFQSLLKDTVLTEEQNEYVESIDFAGKNLLVIVNDVLDLTKIEAGKLEFLEEKIDIGQILKSSIKLVGFTAKEKKLKIFLEHDFNIPAIVVGDASRFNQIVLNLLSNAVKFTESGTIRITSQLIETSEKGYLCEFKIIDTGIGIPLDKQSKIFESFTQAEADTTRKYGGTGLGLTIVKKLLELQGGNINVESVFGEGSTFIFRLNFKKVTAKSFKMGKNSAVVMDETNLDYSKKIKVLLAEDFPLNQLLVQHTMVKWGYDLDIANNGKEAVDLHMANDYDLILMDIQMPEMDGHTATKIIRALPDTKKSSIPIIALTANSMQAELDKCLELGMDACVTKPFNIEFLRKSILSCIAKTNLEKLNKDEVDEIIEEKLFDLTYLKEHADGNKKFLFEMLSIFLIEGPIKLGELNENINQINFEKIKFTAHSMKGLFLTLGMKRAESYLKEIETFAKESSNIELIKERFDEIDKICTQAKRLIKLELEKLKS